MLDVVGCKSRFQHYFAVIPIITCIRINHLQVYSMFVPNAFVRVSTGCHGNRRQG